MSIFSIEQTHEFSFWLKHLKDDVTRRRLLLRLRKASLGNLGDTAPVGEGVMEMREHFGPGWRMYYLQRGSRLIVMLGGGNKASQSSDIVKASQLAARVQE